ncbi:MAG: dephospho-CoA kinase [Phormidesmis sp.]
MRRRIIGLTGGIATGKSTVSDYLASQHELPVLDADVFSREAVAKGSEILGRVRDRYGPNMLLVDGNLNRAQLGKIIFNDEAERQWLEQQIHPYVRDRFSQATDLFANSRVLVYSIPLLFEAKLTHLVTEVWVVACSPQQQLKRLMARNQLARADAQARIDTQISLNEKCQRADHVLDNSRERDYLFSQIDHLLKSV